METVVGIVLLVVGVVGLGLILRNYRRQHDIEETPGRVPEDYS